LVDLMNRSGQGSVWTGTVFDGDTLDYQLGDSPYLRHQPGDECDATKITHVYAIGRAKGAEWPVIECWPVRKVERHRDRYNKVGERHYSFKEWEMYARKVVLLQVLKYLPCSPELATAINLSDAAEVGKQAISIKDAIEGTFVPVDTGQLDGEEREPVQTGGATIEPDKKTGAPEATFASLSVRIEQAKTNEDLDLCASLISALTDLKERQTVTALYQDKHKALNF
jgi:recombination protein RecT